jgi:DNA replication and repair protein RecF
VLLHGPNGAGKTNLLEALHVGTQGFSPRARADGQMIRFDAETGRVALRGTNGATRFETDVRLTTRDARRAYLNGEKLTSAERLRHELRTLVFTPDRLAVVKGAPATRRAYLDRVLGRLLPAKAAIPIEYAAAVGQRNACLRRLRAGVSSPDALRPWTERVATLSHELVEARADAVAALCEPFGRLAADLGLDSATLAYDGEPVTLNELDARLARDLDRGLTGAGPHLHDLRVEAAGRDVRTFGSQGEQRVAILALVLAEADVLRTRMDADPLVLLDDVLSELDEERRRALARIVSGGGQTLLTATAVAAFPAEPAQALAVSPGRIS